MDANEERDLRRDDIPAFEFDRLRNGLPIDGIEFFESYERLFADHGGLQSIFRGLAERSPLDQYRAIRVVVLENPNLINGRLPGSDLVLQTYQRLKQDGANSNKLADAGFELIDRTALTHVLNRMRGLQTEENDNAWPSTSVMGDLWSNPLKPETRRAQLSRYDLANPVLVNNAFVFMTHRANQISPLPIAEKEITNLHACIRMNELRNLHDEYNYLDEIARVRQVYNLFNWRVIDVNRGYALNALKMKLDAILEHCDIFPAQERANEIPVPWSMDTMTRGTGEEQQSAMDWNTEDYWGGLLPGAEYGFHNAPHGTLEGGQLSRGRNQAYPSAHTRRGGRSNAPARSHVTRETEPLAQGGRNSLASTVLSSGHGRHHSDPSTCKAHYGSTPSHSSTGNSAASSNSDLSISNLAPDMRPLNPFGIGVQPSKRTNSTSSSGSGTGSMRHLQARSSTDPSDPVLGGNNGPQPPATRSDQSMYPSVTATQPRASVSSSAGRVQCDTPLSSQQTRTSRSSRSRSYQPRGGNHNQ